MTDIGKIKRYDTGIYFIPKKTMFKSGSQLSMRRVIEEKYLKEDSKRCGYISGITFANQLGITTQVAMVLLPVTNYIGEMMQEEAPEAIKEYDLEPFEMKVQDLNRTLVDKVFAVCDYYLQDNVKQHSRHIYDIYKLLNIVPQNDDFRQLVTEVRNV